MKPLLALLILLLLALIPLGSCAQNKPPKCKLNGATTLGTPPSSFPWPRFRSDMANSGSTAVSLDANAGTLRWSAPIGNPVTIASSPVVGMGQVYFGSSDGQFHVLGTADGTPNTTFTDNLAKNVTIKAANTAAPLLGTNGNVFFATGDGHVLQTESDGTLLRTTTLTGFIGASPNIGDDGEVYVGTVGGSFTSVCPNGVSRFATVIAPTQSTAGVVSNDFCADFYGDPNSETCPRAIVGASDTQVAAFDLFGRQHWAFFASAPVVTAIVLQESATEQFNRAFIVDQSGRLFAVSLTIGAPLAPRPLRLGAPVSASPALVPSADPEALTTLYIADQTGVVTAVEVQTNAAGAVSFTSRVVFTAGAPINSSPAVATGGAAPVIVFGADDGFVYAVVDAEATCDGTCTGGPNAGDDCESDNDCALLWRFDASSPIGLSSPAIDVDGTVYVGTQGGMMFAIGNPVTVTPTPTATATPE